MLAKAKLNLNLHIKDKLANGYHSLESLFAFINIGDNVSFIPGNCFKLELCGDFAKNADLKFYHNNLIKIANDNLQKNFKDINTGTFQLIKKLPISSGIGGGSADAAAALRLLAEYNNITSHENQNSTSKPR